MNTALLLLAALSAAPPNHRDAGRVIRQVAGSAEYLRSVPKKVGKLVKADGGDVTPRFDGDKADTSWPAAGRRRGEGGRLVGPAGTDP